MNSITLDPVPYSRSTLALVVMVHVAAALLMVQIFEARRYVEPMPLLVSLVPALQKPEQILEMPSPLQKHVEPERHIEPERHVEPERQIEPVRQAEPEPLPQPAFRPETPPPVVRAPEPVERAIIPEPVPEPRPAIERVIEPARVAPEPPPPAIVELPVAPIMPTAAPTPAIVTATPVPKSVELPVPPDQHFVATPTPAAPAPVVQEAADIVMNTQTLTAIYLRNPKPLYPNVSRRLGEQGTVTLRVFVTIAGEPARIELKSTSGFPRLDRAALSAVRSWKFAPATRGDQAVDAWVLVPIRFTLKG